MTFFLSDENRQELDALISRSLQGQSRREPIFEAVAKGKAEIVEALLRIGVDKDYRNTDGETPLIIAVQAGHMGVVKFLLSAGASVNIKSYRRPWIYNPSGFTALHLASILGRGDIAIELLRAGALLDGKSCDGSTPLMVALWGRRLPVANALLCEGADITVCNNRGETVLTLAARSAFHEFAETLLRRGADVNAEGLGNGGNALHAVCSEVVGGVIDPENVGKTISVLLRWGADETATDDDNSTPLDLLSNDPDDDILRDMLKRAPFDKAWYRRGWLVMLRVAELRTRAEEEKDETGSGQRQRQRGAGGGGGGDLASVVQNLIEVQEDGVFRRVVGFV